MATISKQHELSSVQLYTLPRPQLSGTGTCGVQLLSTKSPELPMLSLGYHTIWDQTLQKLEAINEVASNKEILNTCLPFAVSNGDDTYPHTMECCELFKECAIPSPDVVVGDENDSKAVSTASKYSVKTVWAPVLKTVLTKVKSAKTKTPKSVIIMSMSHPTSALCAALAIGAPSVVIRLQDFVVTQSSLTLLSLLASQYDSVQLFKPMVSCLVNQGAAFYVVCRQINKTKYDCKPVMEHMAAVSKSHYNTLLPEFVLDEHFLQTIREINKTAMMKEVADINDVYSFFKAKNFQGVAMQEFKQRQEILTKKWEAKYLSGSS